MKRPSDATWMTVAIVLIGVAVMLELTFAGLNRIAIQHELANQSRTRTEQIAAAKAQSDAQIAEAKAMADQKIKDAKTLNAQQVATAKAEVQRQLCALIDVLQPSPVSRQFASIEGCLPVGPSPTSTTSTAPAPSTGSAARPAPAGTPSAASRVGSRPPITPTSAPTAKPSRAPAVCVLVSLICIG